MTLPAPRPRLPPDEPARRELHDEVHARPPSLLPLPSDIVYLALLNDGVAADDELAHLRRLPGAEGLDRGVLERQFLRLDLGSAALQWERHSEFTRYAFVLPAPDADEAPDSSGALDRLEALLPPGWLAAVPGRTIAAVRLSLRAGDPAEAEAIVRAALPRFETRPPVASRMGDGHSLVLTDFRLGADGFERIELVMPAQTPAARAGRVAARLLELETYRLMALRGLPTAKALAPVLAQAERELSKITAGLEDGLAQDDTLLAALVALAARVERVTAAHMYRFSATRAYDAIVRQRIDELQEQRLPGTQTIAEFMRRRLWPAIATVAASAQRLDALSSRIERAGALLRTRVDIAAESHSRALLEKLTRGQQLQLRLQSTVEGLSIAAISYYVVSLLLYGAKAAKAGGVPIHPELAAGASIPLVLLGVTWLTRRIHRGLRD